mgnify:FL=1
MNENKELLVLINENTKMGLASTKELLKLIKEKDNKIKKVLEDELKKYEDLYKKCKSLMKKYKVKSEKSGLLKNLTATLAMRMEVNKDNSDSKLASILIRGFTMGNVDIEAKIKSYKKEASKDILSLAREVLEFGENEIKLLKDFL